MESRVRSYVHVNHRVHTCACTYRIAVALPEGGLVGTSNIQLLHIESINIHALGLQVFILFYLFIFSGSWNNSGKLTFNINQTFQKTTLDVVVGPDLFRVILVVTQHPLEPPSSPMPFSSAHVRALPPLREAPSRLHVALPAWAPSAHQFSYCFSRNSVIHFQTCLCSGTCFPNS